MTRIQILGPQRVRPSLHEARSALAKDGTVAVITAGWEDREGENQEIARILGEAPLDLRLFRRTEHLLDDCPEILAASQEYQHHRRELRDIYNVRLTHALAAATELAHHSIDSQLVREETEQAFREIRRLDDDHLKRGEFLWKQFVSCFTRKSKDRIQIERKEIRSHIESCAMTLIAGGHVVHLLHCLRLFDLKPLLVSRPLIAWSAGAMALCDRVVLFHDSPPQGAGNAEVFDRGLGLCPGLVLFPHARRRLRLDDAERVSRLVARLQPATCLVLPNGAMLSYEGGEWTPGKGIRRLNADGSVEHMVSPIDEIHEETR